MRVELKGRYFDIVEYLKALEGLPWKVFWGEVSLESDKYPISKVSLVIYTLSRYPGWIGV
jgi:MSHA biogenesis protein MshJ